MYAALIAFLVYVTLFWFALRDRDLPQSLGVEARYDATRAAWVVTAVQPTSAGISAGIRRGDIVVTVDRQPPAADGPATADTIRRATEIVTLRPTTDERRVVGELGREFLAPNPTAFSFISVIFFIVGTIACVWGRGAAPLALTLFCYAGAAEFLVVMQGDRQLRWAVLLSGSLTPLLIGGFAYLFGVFPVVRRPRCGRRRLPTAVILAPATLLIPAWLGMVLIAPERYSPVRAIGALYFLACLVGGSALAVYSWWHAGADRERTQLRIVAAGTLIAVVPFLLLSLLPGFLLGSGRYALSPAVSLLPIVALPTAFGYAILRYQIMDLQIYVRRGLVYSIMAVLVSCLYALALFTAAIVAGDEGAFANRNGVIVAALVVGVVAVIGQRLRDLLQRRIDRLFDRRSYDYRQQLLEFSRRTSGILDPDELAQSTIDLIAQTMGAAHVRLYLYEPASRGHHLWVGVGHELPEDERILPRDHPLLEGLATAKGGIVQRLDQPADAVALSIALRHKGQQVALLTLGPKRVELPYTSEDLALLGTVANQLAVATENAQLYGRMRDLYLSGIRTLAATVDAKDSYTHGHSERVSRYSRAIAAALGLPQLEVETIELAGLLHDIGKIGVPDAVLQKPGRLDPEERELIMGHAALGAKILADNPALLSLVPLVRHHHEWHGGGGYPDGLIGDAIPLGAAIISVADTYDTMTTDRPYRKAPGREKAHAEIERCAGTQFNPRVAAAFLGAIGGEAGAEAPAPGARPVAHAHHPLAGRIAPVDTRAMYVVYKVAQVIGTVTEIAPFLSRVIELLRRELGAGGLDIFLIDGETGELCSQSRPKEMPGELEGLRIPAGVGIIGWVAARQLPVRVNDSRQDPRALHVEGWDGRSELAVPLVSEGRTIGVINVESRYPNAFSEDDEALLTIVGHQLAQAIEVARLHDQLKRNATLDGLTGVANHRHFYERLEGELARAERDSARLSLLLVDVDGLKSLNDTHGHLAGDAALRSVAAILRDESRGSDTVARYGGDEFAVILPGLGAGDATRCAERLARALDAASFELEGEVEDRRLPLPRISCGVATYGPDGDRAVALVAVADKRMYGQKNARRREHIDAAPGERANHDSPESGTPPPPGKPIGARGALVSRQ